MSGVERAGEDLQRPLPEHVVRGAEGGLLFGYQRGIVRGAEEDRLVRHPPRFLEQRQRRRSIAAQQREAQPGILRRPLLGGDDCHCPTAVTLEEQHFTPLVVAGERRRRQLLHRPCPRLVEALGGNE